MKKRNIKSLVLNKKEISNITNESVIGGIGVPSRAGTWLPDPKTVHVKLCYLQDNSALHC